MSTQPSNHKPVLSANPVVEVVVKLEVVLETPTGPTLTSWLLADLLHQPGIPCNVVQSAERNAAAKLGARAMIAGVFAKREKSCN